MMYCLLLSFSLSLTFKTKRDEKEKDDVTFSKKHFQFNGLFISKTAHNQMLDDSEYYKTLVEGSDDPYGLFFPCNDEDMMKTYIRFFENKTMLKELLFDETLVYYQFIEFLNKIGSTSLLDVLQMLSDEMTTSVFFALENSQTEEEETSVMTQYERYFLKQLDVNRTACRLLTPVSFLFSDDVYIMLKIQLFQYTVLSSMNARFLVTFTKILRLESKTVLETTATDYETSLLKCVQSVEFPGLPEEYPFNLNFSRIHYANHDGFYYEGVMSFHKLLGVVQHGEGLYRTYEDHGEDEDDNARDWGFYLYNQRQDKFLYCQRQVGEADGDEMTTTTGDDEEKNLCAYNRKRKRIWTEFKSDDDITFRLCQACADCVSVAEMPSCDLYLLGLFSALTGGVNFEGCGNLLASFFEKLNPHASSFVRKIKTFEDYVTYVKPSNEIIRKQDESVREQIRLFLSNISLLKKL